ncbi:MULTISPECIES: hypothetical protein [unclassified Bradyrhizobium]|uniref:hypothetical protein n=1 Tax=unclassified Bradyrhizobium TaxID=2631580 RepID=UPI0028E50CAE|nr:MULTISPECIES: hypothetical protein [unclassified Bradyrhizobium]
MKPKDETRYRPIGVVKNRTRLERFAALNGWVTARGGWIVSFPGAEPVIVECLPGSPLIDELTEAGYELEPAGEGERIIPGQIVQRLGLASNGAFEPLVGDATQPAALTVTHAGIARVLRFSLGTA